MEEKPTLLEIKELETIQDFLCTLGMKPHMHLVEITFFSLNHASPDLPKLLRTSLKPVHKYYLCTGFTKVLNNFGRSDDDMI